MEVKRDRLGDIGEDTEVRMSDPDIVCDECPYGDGSNEYLSTATDPQMNSARALVA